MPATATQAVLDTPAAEFRLPATDGKTYAPDPGHLHREGRRPDYVGRPCGGPSRDRGASLGGNGEGHPLTQNRLAKLLRPLGIAPDTIRISDKTAKGYFAHRFRDAFERFCPEAGSQPSHRNSADEIRTTGAFQTVTEDRDVTVAKCEKPNNDAGCDGVTVVKSVFGENAQVPLWRSCPAPTSGICRWISSTLERTGGHARTTASRSWERSRRGAHAPSCCRRERGPCLTAMPCFRRRNPRT